MADESKLFTEVSFYAGSNRVKEGSSATQVVVHAEVRGVIFPMAKLIPSDRMYQEGLEKNHKPLINMRDKGEHLAELLSDYARIGFFSEIGFNHVLDSYRPFIDTKMTYETLLDRVRLAQSSGGWE